MIITELNLYLPLTILPIYMMLERLDWNLVLSARGLGATRWYTFRRVVLPLTLPGVIAGVIVVFMPVAGTFIVPELLGGTSGLMIGKVIATQFGAATNWAFGATLATVLLAVLAFCALDLDLDLQARERGLSLMKRIASLYLILVYVFLFIPAVVVVLFSLNDSQFWSFPLNGLTLRWYVELLQRPDAMTALWNSIHCGSPDHGVCRPVGGRGGGCVPPPAVSRYRRGRRRHAVAAAHSDPNLGARPARSDDRAASSDGATTIIIAHVLYNAPYVFLLVRARYQTLDDDLERAARGLGATPSHAFRRIVVPHLAPV